MPSQDCRIILQGRINANAARALKSVCLTAAAYSTDDTRKSHSLSKLQLAAVDGIQGYTLDSNYGSMFNQDGAKTLPKSSWHDIIAKITQMVQEHLCRRCCLTKATSAWRTTEDVRSLIRIWCLNAGWNTRLLKTW